MSLGTCIDSYLTPPIFDQYKYLETFQTMLAPHKYTLHDIKALVEANLSNPKAFYVHCPIHTNLLNFAHLPIVQYHTDLLSNLPASAVLHMGNNKRFPREISIANSLNHLNLSVGQYPTNKYVLLVENAAGQGNDLGYTLEQIRQVFEGLDQKKIGFCLDTQHAFASGICNFHNFQSVDRLMEELSGICGLPNLIHLNDSKVEFGRRVDRHENLGRGYIWKDNVESLKRLKQYVKECKIDCILETPVEGIYNDLLYFKSI